MPVAPIYSRSQVYSYNELSQQEQETILSDYCFEESDAQSTSFVRLQKKSGDEYLPLSMFSRLDNSKTWHGVFGTSYFSGYFIRFNRSNDECVVAERFS